MDYGSELGDVKTKPFGLIFDPAEMDEALSLEDVEIIHNTFFQGIIEKTPFEVCCFPYAQHFYTTSIPLEHKIQNENDLEKEIMAINRRNGLVDLPSDQANRTIPCSAYCYSYACKDTCRLYDKNRSVVQKSE